jgi:hypothetical protein
MAQLALRCHPACVTLLRRALLALACCGALAAPVRADDAAPPAPWIAGDRIEAFELADQHGEPGRVDAGVRLLLFAADMDAGALVRDALEADPSLQDLAARGAVFVSDIHRMPALVTRLFALPSMRRRPYRMLLDREPGPTVRIPREPAKLTLLELDALSIRAISFLDSPDAVAQALRAAGEAERPGE